MAKKNLQDAIDQQAAETYQEAENVSPVELADKGRSERLVIRLSKDELRRLKLYFDREQLPLSTGARSVLLRHIREQ